LASDGGDQFRSEETQKHADFFRDAYDAQEELAGRKTAEKPSGGRKWPRWLRNPLFWLALIMWVVYVLFATNAAEWPWENSGAPDQSSPSSGSIQDLPTDESITSESPPADEADEDDEAYAPIEVHVVVGAKDTAVSDRHVASFFQIWPTPKTEGDLPAVATPRLSGGTFDVVYDFEAMTVSGSFDVTYERNTEEDAGSVCPGSPEAFSGTASGSFDDLPIIEAITSDSPPPDWGLSPEDWFPGDEGDWYIGGSFPVELAMSGVAVMGCATLNGETTYGETPFNESATLTAWMRSSIDVARNQGPDHETNAFLNIVAETNESRDSNPFWSFSIAWSHFAERPVPDPLE